jgi:hypothetical protein
MHVHPLLLQDELRDFFNEMMESAYVLVSPGYGVLSCKITNDKGYAFLEMRTVEEASNAMALDGIQFKDTNLKVRGTAAGGGCLQLWPVLVLAIVARSRSLSQHVAMERSWTSHVASFKPGLSHSEQRLVVVYI